MHKTNLFKYTFGLPSKNLLHTQTLEQCLTDRSECTTHIHTLRRGLVTSEAVPDFGTLYTQSAGGDGLRFSPTQICQRLSSLPPPSLGHSEGWPFWMWLCNCNSCLSPKLRGLFMASMELHVHVERTGFWEGRGALPSAQEWLKPIGWHHAKDNSLQESGQRISRGNWSIRGHIYLHTEHTESVSSCIFSGSCRGKSDSPKQHNWEN